MIKIATNAGFNPPSDPPCPYPTYMTHAEAVALRDAGGLDPRCQIVITDGPVIGTSGNTSPTQIELNPAGPDDIGRTARVHTNFDNVAFIGNYNIDDGPNGTLNGLTDHWDNQLSDEDPGSAATHTVHNQFPYHLSGPNLRDNELNDTDLPGLPAFVTAGGSFMDNTIQESTIDLTGVTSPGPAPASFFRRNQMQSSTFTANCPTVYSNNNTMSSSGVQHLGTGASSFSFQDNIVTSGTVSVDAATTVQVTMNNNVIGGTSSGYRIAVQGKTGGLVTASGNRLFGAGLGAQDMLFSGTAGQAQVTGCEIGAGDLSLTGTGNATLTGCDLNGQTITYTGSGLLSLTRLMGRGSTITHGGGGSLSGVDTAMLSGSVVRTLAGQAGSVILSTSQFRRGYVVEVAATSTAAVTLANSIFSGHTSHASGLDMQVDGSGSRAFQDSEVVAHFNQIGLVLVGGGNVTLGQKSTIHSGRLVRDPATTATLSLAQSKLTGTLQQDAGATGGSLTLSATDALAVGLLVQQRGPGAITFNTCRISATVRNAATATRGAAFTNADLAGGTFDQNRTGGTGTDSITSLTMRGTLSSVTLNGAADPGGNQTPVNVATVSEGGALTLTDPVGSTGVCFQRCTVSEGAQVSGTGTLLVDRCRLAAGAVVNMGAFSHSFTVIEGQITVTLTGSNNGRLANAAFNNLV